MALKGKVDSIDEVPEALRDHYTQSGEAWVLDVQDAPGGEKVKQFRQENVELRRKLEEMEALTAGIDVEEYRELKGKASKAREKHLSDKGDFEEIYNQRLAPLKAEKERMEKELKTQLAQREAKLATLLIDNEIRAAAAKNGVRATAVDDVLLRGHSLFKLDGDKVVPMKSGQLIYGKDGEPLGITEWIGGLASDAPHLFNESQGGGTPKHGATTGAGMGGNRISRDDKASILANLSDIASGKKKIV
jgi:hypothetical protein